VPSQVSVSVDSIYYWWQNMSAQVGPDAVHYAFGLDYLAPQGSYMNKVSEEMAWRTDSGVLRVWVDGKLDYSHPRLPFASGRFQDSTQQWFTVRPVVHPAQFKA